MNEKSAASALLKALLLALLIFPGCRWAREEINAGPVTDIAVLVNGTVAEGGNIAVNMGSELILAAVVSPAQDSVHIAWEVSGNAVTLVSSGVGPEATIRGNTRSGTSDISVIAWRDSTDEPVRKIFSVSLQEAPVSDIVLMEGDSPAETSMIIGAGEERHISAKLLPSFASGNITWTVVDGGILDLAETADGYGCTITGENPGKTTLVVRAENGNTASPASASIDVDVRLSKPVINVEIFKGAESINGVLRIGLYEEVSLRGAVSPEDAMPILRWSSSGAGVEVDSSGRIKGLYGAASATISVEAFNSVTNPPKTASITVEVKNPVTGLSVQYDNSEHLPVPGVLHLSPDDAVDLKVDLTPAGVSGTVTWSGGAGVVELSALQGPDCTITGKAFGSGEIVASAVNADTGEPVTAVFSVQVAPLPLWAWDRGRDGGLTGDISSSASNITLTGRGEKNSPVRIRALGNTIGYTTYGLDINSYNTSNSTRIMIGSNTNTSSANGHQTGDFNFLTPNRPIRISVDYEIVKSAPAGRDLWLTVNNNQATQGASVLGSTARILVQPLTAIEGTRATAVGYLNVPNIPDGPGRDSLEKAFVGIICLSNGGRIYVSGIRIEYDDEQTGIEE
ncbi:MAG: hypothetical protein LBQ14_09515 [Treponema sp.]|nr:hypothetical protein [Treponema sp.]